MIVRAARADALVYLAVGTARSPRAPSVPYLRLA